jgi:release factor glutamine methyltransferase
VALDGGSDGLDIVRRLSTAAPRWLAPGGHVLVETSAPQALHAVDAMAGAGLDARVVGSDEWEATVVVARNPPHAPLTE